MRCLHLFLFSLFLFAACPAFAACYGPAERHAEQLLRLHSELMVIAATCRTGSDGEDLPSAYGEFTQANLGPLQDAERTMIFYYQTHAKGDPVSHLDRLRTLLGNEFGMKSAKMSAPAFCAAYRDKPLLFAAASPASVEDEVRRMEMSDRAYVKTCSLRVN